MEARDHAELAAVPATPEYPNDRNEAIGGQERRPWRAVFDDAFDLAQRFGGARARAQRD